ncbi:Glutamine--fructose-6-phosphate transaminase (isomerizing) [Haliangium ochraceum DSM 14365]|uniref:Glutamine--fructose-6-phosphate transaminase (Isomerizing) n=2 Tax=Haliangium ochraceum TaxID=80816 RepID=D0LVP7_HALO1|nr:Glutamine--fructose-6-phosphate transaminase (isomerizing) [Haliangium ochraceum DSM 14365]
MDQTLLYREIHQQPQVLTSIWRSETDAVDELAAQLRQRSIERVLIAARGSSDNAARYAQYLLGTANRMLVTLAAPSLFSIYRTPPSLAGTLVLGISQSGRSPDIVSVVEEARRQGALSAAITNDPESPLGRAADLVIALHAGEERSVAATKSYTGELMAVAMLSAALADDASMRSALGAVPGHVEHTLAAVADQVSRCAEAHREARSFVVIGRGYNYATAFELALKLKELSYMLVGAYSGADFLHGPLAIIEPGFPVLAVAPSGAMLPSMRALIDQLRARGASLVPISDSPAVCESARLSLALPVAVDEWLSPFLSVLPGQLLALELAHARGVEVDTPRALQKITETR